MLTIVLVICTVLIVVSFCASVWTLVMVLPFEIPILSRVVFMLNGRYITLRNKRRRKAEFYANYDPDND